MDSWNNVSNLIAASNSPNRPDNVKSENRPVYTIVDKGTIGLKAAMAGTPYA
jgi:hypothetical protein